MRASQEYVVSPTMPDLPRVAPTPAPAAGGWASTAMAIHAVRRMPSPVLLRIDVVGAGSLLIDPRIDGYTGLAAESLPIHPTAVHVETHPIAQAAPPSTAPRGDLDAVLWHIGEHAFGEERATWLWEGDRYRLTRWPRVTRLTVDLDSIKMFAALGAASITVEELSVAADVTREQAQRTINALSLMGIVTSKTAAPPTPRAEPQPSAGAPEIGGSTRATAQGRHSAEPSSTNGLFSRLRRKLGL